MKRKLLTAAATIPLVTAALVGGVASPAQADCSHSWSNKDGEYGYTIWSDPGPVFRSGPHGKCSYVAPLPGGTKLFYHCYVVNEWGNTWTHARRAGTNIQGWIWDDYLADGGSDNHC